METGNNEERIEDLEEDAKGLDSDVRNLEYTAWGVENEVEKLKKRVGRLETEQAWLHMKAETLPSAAVKREEERAEARASDTSQAPAEIRLRLGEKRRKELGWMTSYMDAESCENALSEMIGWYKSRVHGIARDRDAYMRLYKENKKLGEENDRLEGQLKRLQMVHLKLEGRPQAPLSGHSAPSAKEGAKDTSEAGWAAANEQAAQAAGFKEERNEARARANGLEDKLDTAYKYVLSGLNPIYRAGRAVNRSEELEAVVDDAHALGFRWDDDQDGFVEDMGGEYAVIVFHKGEDDPCGSWKGKASDPNAAIEAAWDSGQIRLGSGTYTAKAYAKGDQGGAEACGVQEWRVQVRFAEAGETA